MKQIKLGNKNLFATVDDSDYERVKHLTWYADKVGKTTYAIHSESFKHKTVSKIYMHRFITNAPKGVRVDHRDGDGLNNTRANLRVATVSQNAQNTSVSRANNTSGYKGVSFEKQTGKWRASLTLNRKIIHLGRFDDIKDAARAYNQAVIEYYGEFARLNDV